MVDIAYNRNLDPPEFFSSTDAHSDDSFAIISQ